MESKLTDDVGPLAASASSFPVLVYDYEHGDPPEISQTVLSVADGNIRTIRVPDDVGPLAASASSFPLLVYYYEHDYEHGNPPEISQTVLSVADGNIRTIQVPDDVGPLAASASSFPLLVYDYEHGDPPEISQTVLSVADGNIRTIRVPEMCDYTCLETPQGLVLMVDTASGSCWLWNPQTGEKTALPSMDGELPYQCRCLISDATSCPPHSVDPLDSLVLVYDLTRPELLFCRIRGGAGWVKQTYDLGIEVPAAGEGPTPIVVISAMAAVQGVFYYSESRDVIGALFSFTDDPVPSLELVTFDAPLPTLAVDTPQLIATKSYLLESSRELFLVCLFYIVSSAMEHIELEEVGAYVMDFTKKEWCKVTDIGDAAFLLGPGAGCFAASCSAAEHGLKSGCVYLVDDNYDLHIFDLKEGTRELVRPTQDIPALSREPFWLVPVLPQSQSSVN